MILSAAWYKLNSLPQLIINDFKKNRKTKFSIRRWSCKSTSFHLATSDGLKLYAKEWKPESQAKAVIVLVHGLGEHIGRYEHVAQRYTDANYIFRAFDLRGHGKSEGTRGHALSYDQLMNDIDAFIQMAHTAYPELPVFLYGHSLGGALVLYFGETRQNHLKGIIATSPGLAPTEPVPAFKLAAGKLLARIAACI